MATARRARRGYRNLWPAAWLPGCAVLCCSGERSEWRRPLFRRGLDAAIGVQAQHLGQDALGIGAVGLQNLGAILCPGQVEGGAPGLDGQLAAFRHPGVDGREDACETVRLLPGALLDVGGLLGFQEKGSYPKSVISVQPAVATGRSSDRWPR